MTKLAPVDPSTRPLSEVARHVVIPDGIVDTLWFEVEERCREFGDEFDAWQDGLGQIALGLRADGTFAATIGGITLSIPRQVAKTFIVMRIVVALCTLYPNLTVIWTAHRLRTASNTFGKMKAYVLRSSVRSHLQPGQNQGTAIRDANGEQQIPFRNGSVIMFGAREQGFGRGFDEVDIEVFDEAQILSEKALEDMVAATNQSRFPFGALLFYMGTPPRPVDPGEVFENRRSEALAFKSDDDPFGVPVVGEDSVYVECSADPGADPEDREQWARANPSYPHRTPLVSLLRLRKNLPAAESWCREALGMWDEIEESSHPIPNWEQLVDERSAVSSRFSWSLVVTKPGRHTWSTVAFAGERDDGLYHVEIADNRPGTDGLIDRCVAIWEQERVPLRVHNVKDALEAAHIAELRARGVDVDEVSTTKFAHATGMFTDAAETFRLRHLGQSSLSKAVDRAELVKSVWVEKHPGADIGPLKAVTIALGGVPSAVVDGPSVYEERGVLSL